MKKTAIQEPIAIIGTLISISVSVVLFVAGISTIYSVIIGLCGIILSLSLNHLSSHRQLEEKVLSTIQLNRELYKDEWLLEHIKILLSSWENIRLAKIHPIFNELAHAHLDEMSSKLKQIASGELITDGYDYRWLTTLVDEAKNQLCVTSLVSLDWWKSPVGKKYWESNLVALKRGIKITRIFICQEIIPDLLTIASKMQEQGVEVHFAKISELPENLRVDIVISDSSLVWTTSFSPDMLFKEHHISSRHEDIERAKGIFTQILYIAESYKNLSLEKV